LCHTVQSSHVLAQRFAVVIAACSGHYTRDICLIRQRNFSWVSDTVRNHTTDSILFGAVRSDVFARFFACIVVAVTLVFDVLVLGLTDFFNRVISTHSCGVFLDGGARSLVFPFVAFLIDLEKINSRLVITFRAFVRFSFNGVFL
jgi:hypothetical protein